MGENNSKWNNWQRINFQNIQAVHATLYQKANLVKKWAEDLTDISPMKIANKYMKRCSTLLIIKEEKAMATHSSTLAWKIPRMEEPGRLQSAGLQRVRHD